MWKKRRMTRAGCQEMSPVSSPPFFFPVPPPRLGKAERAQPLSLRHARGFFSGSQTLSLIDLSSWAFAPAHDLVGGHAGGHPCGWRAHYGRGAQRQRLPKQLISRLRGPTLYPRSHLGQMSHTCPRHIRLFLAVSRSLALSAFQLPSPHSHSKSYGLCCHSVPSKEMSIATTSLSRYRYTFLRGLAWRGAGFCAAQMRAALLDDAQSLLDTASAMAVNEQAVSWQVRPLSMCDGRKGGEGIVKGAAAVHGLGQQWLWRLKLLAYGDTLKRLSAPQPSYSIRNRTAGSPGTALTTTASSENNEDATQG